MAHDALAFSSTSQRLLNCAMRRTAKFGCVGDGAAIVLCDAVKEVLISGGI
jgi:hypothetical protein